jgi:DNA primase
MRRRFPNAIDTEALKRERPLADVVAAYGIALRQGSRGLFWGLCPFHQERTPSFCVDVRDPVDMHFFCYGACGAGGDVITFVMAREDCSFLEACERLAGRGRPPAVHPLPVASARSSGTDWDRVSPTSAESRVLQLAGETYQEAFDGSATAQAYVRGRGVPDALAHDQRLGYADGTALIERLRQESLLDVGVRLGMVLKRPPDWGAGPPYREFFTERIVVPELRQGRPIWFIGRATEEQPTRRPKYLSLPGPRPLLGLEAVQGQRVVYVCEGPFDWLAARAWGLPACCLCGTHAPPERLPALDEAIAVYGVFDPDKAGLNAAQRLASMVGARWRPVHLPDGLDLAELATHGPASRALFEALVGRARAAAWLQEAPA